MYYVSSVASSFSKSGRKPLFDSKETPGPGKYNYSQRLPSATNIKFGNEKRLRYKTPDIPGVGSYDVSTIASKTHAVFPKQSNSASTFIFVDSSGNIINKDLDIPGPGQYNPELSAFNIMSKSPSYSIKNKPRNNHSESIPGPGHYYINKSTNNCSNISKTASLLSSSFFKYFKQTP